MVINRRIFRVLRENLAQYTGSVALIILSCFIFTGMTMVGANLQRLALDFKNQNVQEDATFTTSKPLGDLQTFETAAGAVIEEGGVYDAPLSGGVTLRIFSANEKVNTPAVIEGKHLSGSRDILLNPVFAQAHGYKIGSPLKVAGQTFTVVGYLALPNYIYPLQSDTDIMYSQQKFGIAVISKEAFAKINQGSTFYAVKFLQPDPDPRAQSARFRALLRGEGIDIAQWTDIGDNKRVSYVTLEIDALNTMNKVMPTTLLLLTSILICTVIGRMIHRESTIIGSLYALGYQKSEVVRHYLVFPLAIALIGGAIGTILGVLIVRPGVMFMLTVFTIPMTGLIFDLPLILVSLLLPILFLGVSSFVVIWKALKHSPVELIKGDQHGTRVNFLERALQLDRLSFSMKFKIREQLRSLSRLALLLVGCASATMLMLYGFAIQSSLDSLSTKELTGTFHFQHEYVFNSPRFGQAPEGTEPFSAALFLPQGGNQRDFYISGILPNSKLLSFSDLSGAPLPTNQVIITKPLANQLNVSEGDRITVVRKTDERQFSVTIDRIADTYVGKYIFMPIDDYNRMFEMPEGSYLGLWSPRALDIPQDQLYSQKSIDETIAALVESFAPVRSLIVSFSVIAFVIGLIVIYLVTSMIIEENKSTISLMKIFGYRKKEVNSLVLNSSTMVVVIGFTLGVPLILASISGLLQSLDNSIGITLPVRINPIFILVCFVVVMLCFELSKLLCRKKVDGVPMSEALKAGTE